MGSAILTVLLRLITSRLAGPVGLGLSLVLGVSLLVAQGQVKARNATIRHQVGQIAHLAQDLQQAVANERGLTAELIRQNGSLTAWSKRGRRATAEAERAVQRNRGAVATAEKARVVIAAPVQGADTCARAQEVDRRLMDALR